MIIAKILDFLFYDFVIQKSFELKEELFHNIRSTADTDRFSKPVSSALHDMETIDGKSAAALTHISIITSALVLFASIEKSGYLRSFIYLEISLYLFSALLFIRCLNFMGPPYTFDFHDAARYEINLFNELVVRKSYYIFAVNFVYVLTIVLIIGTISKSILEYFCMFGTNCYMSPRANYIEICDVLNNCSGISRDGKMP